MKKTFLITFLVYMGLTIFSCDNPKENGFSTTLNSNTVDSLELTSTAFFKMDTLKQVSSYIQPLIKGKVTRVFKVDFDGDGKLDFICQYKPVTNIDKADFLEDWITSDKKLFKRLKSIQWTLISFGL